ncbi:MAG: epimerase, partial [Akkermansiaceae bacterium]|nr:epimerase [Akkermansiaceae bacterium]
MEFTRKIVESMRRMDDDERPRVLVNASAMGIYAPAGDDPIEESGMTGQGRLAELCLEWEAAAREAERLGVRVVLLRTGIVLGKGGEAWGRLRRLFGRGLG